MNPISLSVPGKLILMGEHAAVYSRPALVTALGLRLRLWLTEAPAAEGVQIDLPDLEYRAHVSWSSIEAYTQEARRRWLEYSQDPEASGFAAVRGPDPAHVVKLALGETQELLGRGRPGLRLRIRSELPVGSGFGSSAAAAVAVIQGYLRFCGAEASPETVDQVALEVERRQHGQPSGIDSATVLRGGLLWATRRDKGDLSLETVPEPGPLMEGFHVFHSGRPGESTGAVVSAVGARSRAKPQEFSEALGRMEEATWMLRRGLGSSSPEQVVVAMRAFEAQLEELGVVPPQVQAVVRRVEEGGGAAKISGAGSLRGPGAGCLLVYHPLRQEIRRWEFLAPFPEIRAAVGVAGIREEELS